MNETRHNLPAFLPFLLSLMLAGPLLCQADELPTNRVPAQRLSGDLRKNDWILQAATLRRLGELKQEDAARSILEVFQASSNDWIRAQALIGLAKVRPKEIHSRIGTLISHPDPAVRILSLRALEFSREPAGVPLMKNSLSDPDLRVRWSALTALAAIDGVAAWSAIEPALKNITSAEESASIRDVTRALVYVGSPAAWEWIDRLLDRHSKDELSSSLIRGLVDVHDPLLIPRIIHVMQVLRDDPVRSRSCQRALHRYSKAELSAAVSRVFRSAETNDLPAAAQVAGTLCPGLELGELIAGNIARNPDMNPAVMGIYLDALSNPEMGPSRYQAMYQGCLAVKDPFIRRAAVRGLAKCSGADLFEILGPLLKDESQEVRRAVLEVLGSLPPARAPADIAGYIGRFMADDLGGSNAVRRVEVARAISGACDVRQLMDVARPQGYIVDWMVLGSFPSDKDNGGFQQKQPPEDKIDFSQTFKTKYGWTGEGANPQDQPLEREIKWQRTSLVLGDGMLSLGYVMPPTKYGICYAVADVRSERALTVNATLAVDNCAVLWLNGRQLERLEPVKPPEGPVVTKEVQLPLVAGINRIVIKVGNLEDDWAVGIRLHDENGSAIVLPSGLAPPEKPVE